MKNLVLNKETEVQEQLQVLIIGEGVSYGNKLRNIIYEKNKARVLGQASTLSAGYSMFINHLPDLIFLSTELPDGNWFKAVSDFRNIKPGLKVVIVSDALGNFTKRKLQEANIDHCIDRSIGFAKLPDILTKMTEVKYS